MPNLCSGNWETNTKSSKDNYQYINFFRQIPTKQHKNVEENYKEKEIEDDDDNNKNKNNDYIFKYYKKGNKYNNKINKEYEDNRDNADENDCDDIKINKNYYIRDYNKDKRTFHKNENENEKNKKFEGEFKIREKSRFDEVDNQEYLKRRDEDNIKRVYKDNNKQKYNKIDNDNNNVDDDNNVFVTKNRKIIKTIIKTDIEKDNDIPKREIREIRTEIENNNNIPERELKKIKKYNYIDEEDDSCQ
jgi:hypothetical protein